MRTLKLFLPLLLTLTVFTLAAQPPRGRMNPDERRENMESMKIAFLTKEIKLTSDEAKKFWPVYNDYTEELKKIREARNERLKDARNDFGSMSDKEVEKVIDTEMASRQQELDLQKQYNSRFKETLPIKKVALLYRAEEKFKRELLELIKERRDGKGGRP
jgi:hypothetical protein